MGNSVLFEIKGHGIVILEMNSKKELILNNMLYLQKNSQEPSVRIIAQLVWILSEKELTPKVDCLFKMVV